MIQFLRKINKFYSKTAIIQADEAIEFSSLLIASYNLPARTSLKTGV